MSQPTNSWSCPVRLLSPMPERIMKVRQVSIHCSTPKVPPDRLRQCSRRGATRSLRCLGRSDYAEAVKTQGSATGALRL